MIFLACGILWPYKNSQLDISKECHMVSQGLVAELKLRQMKVLDHKDCQEIPKDAGGW